MEGSLLCKKENLEKSLLVEAAQRGHLSIIKFLLTDPMWFRARKLRNHALEEAEKNGHRKVVQRLEKDLATNAHKFPWEEE